MSELISYASVHKILDIDKFWADSLLRQQFLI